MEIGVLLPHFSNECSWERLIGFSVRIEDLGFDSVWVRDHLSYVRHGYELEGDTFIDPFITLGTIAGETRTLKLGTAVLVPFRHPVLTAQMVGSLWWTSQGRVEIGLGPGNRTKPFELAGVAYEKRIDLCKDTAEVLRLVGSGKGVAYCGKVVSFEGVTIDPAPPRDLRLWYGGATARSVRRAAEYCDGIMPALCTVEHLHVLSRQIRKASPEKGIMLAPIPFVSVGSTHELAVEKIDWALPQLLESMSRRHGVRYSTAEDLRGALIVGTSEECTEQIQELMELGSDLLILDLRLVMHEFEDTVEWLARDVLSRWVSGSERN